jgi:SAM-dependent methyltransferase
MVRAMQTQPLLTDRPALDRNRARALRAPALFLHEGVALEIHERLNEVNRTFTSPAVVTPFPDLWRGVMPDARIIADTDLLDLTTGAHDLIIHALALHWANDLVGQLVQCRRALKPDGMFLGLMFGGQTLSELRSALAEAEAQVSGGLSPRVLPMGEIRDLGGLLQRAGLALPVADSIARQVRYRDAFHLMADLRAMGEGNALHQRLRHPTRRAVFTKAAQIYQDTFAGSDGRVSATFEVICLTGWAPDDSQQKPLRPGSATHRLADQLGTDEKPLPRNPANS